MSRIAQTLVGSLDPTLSLLPMQSCPIVPASDLHLYLRLFYLFLGQPIIPRTYFIHGFNNPFFETYSIPGGKEELRQLLTSGAALVSGHTHDKFSTFSKHFEVTKGQSHPLVPPNIDVEYCNFLDDCFEFKGSDAFIKQKPEMVTQGFRSHFLEAYTKTGATEDQARTIDRLAEQRLAKRNKSYEVRRDEGEWGRNEICDLVQMRLLADGSDIAKVLYASVVAYQQIFAKSVADSHPMAQAHLSYSSYGDGRHDYTNTLLSETSKQSVWEINLDSLSNQSWEDVMAFAASDRWLPLLAKHEAALSVNDREEAINSLDRLFVELRVQHRPVKNERTGCIGVFEDEELLARTVAGVVGGGAPVLFYLLTESDGAGGTTDLWYNLTAAAIGIAMPCLPLIHEMAQRRKRRARYEYLYDWRKARKD